MKGGEKKLDNRQNIGINPKQKEQKMTEESKKKEFVYHSPTIEDFNSSDYLVTRIGVGTGISDDHPNRYDRFEIAFKRYKLEDFDSFEDALKALEEDRGIKADYQNILDRLVATMFTAPDYHSVLCYQEGEIDPEGNKIDKESPYYKLLKPNGHEEAQSLADSFVVGAKRTAGPSQKKLAQEAKAAQAQTGMTVAEMAAKIKEMQEAGKLD